MTSVRRATLFSLSQRYTSFAIQLVTEMAALHRVDVPAIAAIES